MEDVNNSYLSFKIGSDTFAVHVSKVNEIKEYETPRKVPESISFMRGVIDFRDEIVPVIDTGLKFGMDAVEITPQTCIIVLDVTREDTQTNFKVGVMTDAVTDVFEAEEESFKKISTDYSPAYIRATYNYNDNFYLILNSDKVFSVNDIISMGNLISEIRG